MSKRVLTGMRTTGALHLGHYVGALQQWINVQNSGKYECFFLLADIQALTTHAKTPHMLTQSVKDVVLDWLSVGLDPTLPNVHFVLQSQIVERHELSILFSMIAKYNEVVRNPTLKAELKKQDEATIGFMAYPVDQVADIYMINPVPMEEGDEILVPVGQDQVPHLEYARVLARRFNHDYAKDLPPVFTPCEPLVGPVGRLMGIHGNEKMGKSADNAIFLSDSAEDVRRKVMSMYTNPQKKRRDDKGSTKGHVPIDYHRAFNADTSEVNDMVRRYRAGTLGDVEIKRRLVEVLEPILQPMRERRTQYESVDMREILEEGTRVTRAACALVTERVRELMHLTPPS